MDLIPIVPYTTTVLSLGMGERYNIIVNASQSSGNYWIRAIPQVKCSDSHNPENIKGIFMYDSTNTTEPETLAYSYTNSSDDEDMSDLAPYLALDTSTDATEDDFAIAIGKSDNVFKWFMAATTFVMEWADPTLLQIYEDDTKFTTSSHVIELDTADEWVYFIIETTQPVPDPIHLHGHDFYVLAQESINIFFHSHLYQSAQKRCRYASFSGTFGHCVPD